ncbi:hypothetical protein SAV14893_052890 [Streptomyces avermitilis]|uniref:Uncharacterized protein n=1 Tax=Streptomyces avermitilis TaxID=33903 RepID=A0A4D4M247_STRAX|nr:hypothetical protein SAV14893_052890 [Streptomyces avermitilis]
MGFRVFQVLPGGVGDHGREQVDEGLQGGYAGDGHPAVGAPAPLKDQRQGAVQLLGELAALLAVALEVGAVPGHDRADPGPGARVELLESVPPFLVEERPAVDEQDAGAGRRHLVGGVLAVLGDRGGRDVAGRVLVVEGGDGGAVVQRADQLLGQ